MSRKLLASSLITAALAFGAGSATAHPTAGMGQGPHDRMPEFMAHHGFQRPGVQQDEPAKLGVAIAAIPQAELDKLDVEYGVRVEKVLDGSVAERTGLKVGDVVTDVNDRPAYSPERLQYLVRQAQGASSIAVLRGGESMKLQAAFAEPEKGKAALGVRIQEMTDELKEAFGTKGSAGVLISRVAKGSAANAAGLKAGDVIVSMAGDDITSVAQVHDVLSNHSPGDSLEVVIVRERVQETLTVALGSGDQQMQAKGMKPHGMPGYGDWQHGRHGHRYHGSQGMIPKHGCGQMRKGRWSS